MYLDWGIKDGIEFWIGNKELMWMVLIPDYSNTISGSIALTDFSTTFDVCYSSPSVTL